MRIILTVLCGGAGSRLWPLSRELHPKPFIRLADGESLLQKAFLRGAHLPNVIEALTLTNRELYFQTEDEYRAVNKASLATSFILEPMGRNTAPAIAAAALTVAKAHGEDAILLVLPADHLVANQPAFAEAASKAARLAAQGKLVTFGIMPTAPETGYGYIEAEGNRALRFVEKPSLEQAKEYITSGRYVWNAGMFCFAAGSMINEMRRHAPQVISAVEQCLASAEKREDRVELPADSFQSVPDISIDYAIMEKSDQVAVVPCDIGWSDIGSWKALGELVAPDENGNRIQGEALLQDAENCYIHGNGRIVGVLGVNNLIIIDTPDALLVADHGQAQNVKHMYAKLKKDGHEAHRLHRTVYRPWGTYTVLEEGQGFKIKRIEVKPGASLSLQTHKHRSEHWVVVSGTAKVINGEQEMLVAINQSTYIPAGNKHRLTNPGSDTLVMIEVQSGNYLGEDDIVRYDDHYGRTA